MDQAENLRKIMQQKEEQAKELLAAFDQRYPDMLLGYTKERWKIQCVR